MILRAPVHLLVLVGLLVTLGGQTARSQPDQQPAPISAVSRTQPSTARAIATFAAPSAIGIATAALTNTLYLPNIMKVVPPPVDLSIDGMEITQAVQTPSNSVPLIAGRPAIVRVYAKYTGTAVPGSVTVSLTGVRDGVALPPVTLGPQAVSASPSRASYSSSFNLPLPASWLSGAVAMRATVDSGGEVAESDETNNTATAVLVFHSVPALDIVIVPINYSHTGPINPGLYPPPTVDTISDFIKRTYPLSTINVTFHAPYNFTGDLGDPSGYYWGNNIHSGLLDQVTALKTGEVGVSSPKVYYGLVSTGASVGDTWLPLSSGFILGIGWIGTRASAGLDIPASFGLNDPEITSDTAAHEIGHNLGRYHAPCKTTTGLDNNYPAADASIVQFGVDVSNGIVLNPDATKDVMSYCDPQWVSDYTYQALYTALGGTAIVATSAAPGASWVVRAGIDPDGTATLAPLYTIAGVPDAAPNSSDYRVEFLDAAGKVVLSQPVAVSEMEQPHVVALSQGKLVPQTNALSLRGMNMRAPQQAINAIVAAPAHAFSSMRLVRAGAVLATRALRPAGPAITAASPSAERQADGALLLRWGAAGRPALVRYTADNGATWTTLGVDVLGGELSIDPGTLPAGSGYFEIAPADSAAPIARIAAP